MSQTIDVDEAGVYFTIFTSNGRHGPNQKLSRLNVQHNLPLLSRQYFRSEVHESLRSSNSLHSYISLSSRLDVSTLTTLCNTRSYYTWRSYALLLALGKVQFRGIRNSFLPRSKISGVKSRHKYEYKISQIFLSLFFLATQWKQHNLHLNLLRQRFTRTNRDKL